VGLDEELGLHTQGGHTGRIARSLNSCEQHAVFAHKLQGSWRLTMGFWNIYCELLQIRQLNIELKIK
jgi:hypothetical protein